MGSESIETADTQLFRLKSRVDARWAVLRTRKAAPSAADFYFGDSGWEIRFARIGWRRHAWQETIRWPEPYRLILGEQGLVGSMGRRGNP